MSAQEIIVELARMSRTDLEQVDNRVRELLRRNGGSSAAAEQRVLEASEPATNLAPPADKTAGGLLDYLEQHCLGRPVITPERRAAVRAGRGRRSRGGVPTVGIEVRVRSQRAVVYGPVFEFRVFRISAL